MMGKDSWFYLGLFAGLILMAVAIAVLERNSAYYPFTENAIIELVKKGYAEWSVDENGVRTWKLK